VWVAQGAASWVVWTVRRWRNSSLCRQHSVVPPVWQHWPAPLLRESRSTQGRSSSAACRQISMKVRATCERLVHCRHHHRLFYCLGLSTSLLTDGTNGRHLGTRFDFFLSSITHLLWVNGAPYGKTVWTSEEGCPTATLWYHVGPLSFTNPHFSNAGTNCIEILNWELFTSNILTAWREVYVPKIVHICRPSDAGNTVGDH